MSIGLSRKRMFNGMEFWIFATSTSKANIEKIKRNELARTKEWFLKHNAPKRRIYFRCIKISNTWCLYKNDILAWRNAKGWSHNSKYAKMSDK